LNALPEASLTDEVAADENDRTRTGCTGIGASTASTACLVSGQPSQEANDAVPSLARSGTPPTVHLAELPTPLAQRVLAIPALPSASSGLSPAAHASPAARAAAAGLPPTALPPAIAAQVAVLSARSEGPAAAHATSAAPEVDDELPEPPEQTIGSHYEDPSRGAANIARPSAEGPPAEHARSGAPKARTGLPGPLANPPSAVPTARSYDSPPMLRTSSGFLLVRSGVIGWEVVRDVV
jgi:hypothetical protein